jgi:hypothetical protein
MKISKLTTAQKELFVVEFLRFRNQEELGKCIDMDIDLKAGFPWGLSSQGHEFWMDIDNGKQPFITVPASSDCCKVLEMTKEAERRGFALGVWTKYGQIVTNEDHELLPNGDFYYRNIKVFKNGKWIKAREIPTQKTLDEQQKSAEMFSEILPMLLKLKSLMDK